MRPVPLNVQTLYADLTQKVLQENGMPGSISRKVVGGKTYLYAVERHGAARIQRYLGPEHDPAAQAAADGYRRQSDLARSRRNAITMLKAAGVSAPAPQVGRLLEALSRAGLFQQGLILVGTVAYQLYPLILGHELDEAAMATQDADFVASNVRLVVDGTDESMPDETGDAEPAASAGRSEGGLLSILKRADATFAPAPTLKRNGLPFRFTASSGLDVELLTPVRHRREEEPVPLPGLRAGAVPLHFLEYLVDHAFPAVALHGAGVRVALPLPERFAVHKLIVAQRRGAGSPKRGKDLAQARALFAALETVNPDAVEDALDDARGRGPAWRSHVEAGLRQIGRAS